MDQELLEYHAAAIILLLSGQMILCSQQQKNLIEIYLKSEIKLKQITLRKKNWKPFESVSRRVVTREILTLIPR